MENLAPAGNRAGLERAEAGGADAVYLGYAAFSARAGAGNFDREEMAEAIRYAHLRGMRVHVTVNTLVKDAELEEVGRVLRLLDRLGADAILVQDLGVLRLARSLCPELTIHASTQMAIHNRTGVRWCGKMGIGRVVLARECSLEEIRLCCRETPEIEVFVHGAQCVSVSGLCLFSSMVGERSGNRGRCAQPCRKTYLYRGRKGAWLSPRDLCLRDDLPALEAAGVASIKIEGRLKRPEYAAITAAAYRKGLDSLEAGAFLPADGREKEGLLQAFHRGDFMRGYAFGCEDAGVIDPEGVRHTGLELGTVVGVQNGLLRVRLCRDLHHGDGLRVDRMGENGDFLYAGPDGLAGETVHIRPRSGLQVQGGDRISRLTDAKQLEEVNRWPGRRIPVAFRLRAMPGEPLQLEASDGIRQAEAEGEMVQRADLHPAAEEELTRRLGKTGDTVFQLREARIETENAFVPVAALNALRREALASLAEKRMLRPEHGEGIGFPAEKLPRGDLPPMAVVRTPCQADAVRGAGFRVVYRPESYREEALESLLGKMPAGDWLHLPEVCEEETLERIYGMVQKWAGRLGGVVLGSAGQLGRDWPVPFGAGSGVPVMNRQAATCLFEAGCAFVTASQELTGKELKHLTAGDPPITVRVYGRTQLMLLHHCPARTALGLQEGRRHCRLCEEGSPDALEGSTLDDPRGYRYPLLRERLPEGCLVRLLNDVPTDLMSREGISFRSLELTTETPAECAEILEAFQHRRRFRGPATSGHWSRPVE